MLKEDFQTLGKIFDSEIDGLVGPSQTLTSRAIRDMFVELKNRVLMSAMRNPDLVTSYSPASTEAEDRETEVAQVLCEGLHLQYDMFWNGSQRIIATLVDGDIILKEWVQGYGELTAKAVYLECQKALDKHMEDQVLDSI
jgi:hypothetical protein